MEKNKKLLLFGKGLYAEIALQYFTDDSEYEVVAFVLDDEYCTEQTYLGLPLVKFSKVKTEYPPSNFDIHVALSYTDFNKLRERVYKEVKKFGYFLPSYISSKCSLMTKEPIGDNCFIFEDNTIQPFVKIGNNIILWSGNHIGHHGVIEDHNFISSHVVISGQCTIKSNCFIGVNSTIAHKVTVNKETLVGAGSIINKDTVEKGVYVPAKTVKLDKTSNMFSL